MFVGSNLVLQWVPGVKKLSGETQKYHRVGFHRVCYRGVSKPEQCHAKCNYLDNGKFGPS